ncbi:PH domain-containing protein [Paenibacillus albicereus]|uniref:PH domain-containing protein n=1 Tax=Paenibacillus albicereus TaxID=2726185 RepID=A0A6H2GTI5_9BACL|nr:PH domain-containing protein [Paenibacillus albicereus]QJC50468.1 PH domain-containing protein [Paenibacillus albicereus]
MEQDQRRLGTDSATKPDDRTETMPERPPSPGEEPHADEPLQALDPRVIRARRLEGAITSGVYAAIVLALALLSARFGWPWWIAAGAGALGLAGAALELLWLPRLLHRSWGYLVREHEIELAHGIFIRKRTLIPVVRIQHIDTKQGPIQKRCGIATLTMATAAGSHAIPGLPQEQAEAMRSRLAELTRRADDEI